MKIFVGNLSFETTRDELRQEFAAFGEVASVDVVEDKYSGRPRGFAFVEMPSISEGQAAIDALNGKTLRDRTLTVNAARERSDTRSRGTQQGSRRGGGFNRGFDKGGRQRY